MTPACAGPDDCRCLRVAAVGDPPQPPAPSLPATPAPVSADVAAFDARWASWAGSTALVSSAHEVAHFCAARALEIPVLWVSLWPLPNPRCELAPEWPPVDATPALVGHMTRRIGVFLAASELESLTRKSATPRQDCSGDLRGVGQLLQFVSPPCRRRDALATIQAATRLLVADAVPVISRLAPELLRPPFWMTGAQLEAHIADDLVGLRHLHRQAFDAVTAELLPLWPAAARLIAARHDRAERINGND